MNSAPRRRLPADRWCRLPPSNNRRSRRLPGRRSTSGRHRRQPRKTRSMPPAASVRVLASAPSLTTTVWMPEPPENRSDPSLRFQTNRVVAGLAEHGVDAATAKDYVVAAADQCVVAGTARYRVVTISASARPSPPRARMWSAKAVPNKVSLALLPIRVAMDVLRGEMCRKRVGAMPIRGKTYWTSCQTGSFAFRRCNHPDLRTLCCGADGAAVSLRCSVRAAGITPRSKENDRACRSAAISIRS